MAALSSKLRSVDVNGSAGVAFWCPGCDRAHVIAVEGPKAWAWDRNVEAPTFSPSIRVTSRDERGPTVCHSFVRAGVIEFLGDCTHKLAGTSTPLPDFPTEVGGMR